MLVNCLVGDSGMATFVCPICEHDLTAVMPLATSMQDCPVCSNRITLPPPVVDFLETDKRQQTDRGQSSSHRLIWKRQAELLLDWMHLYQPEGAILEVGCGTAEFLEAACDQGRDVYSVQATAVGIRSSSDLNVPMFHGDLQQVMGILGDFRFDSIVMFRSLGRWAHPLQVLVCCRQLLSSSGLLFIEVPNAGSVDARRLGGSWPLARLDQHHVHFTESGLRHILKLAGLRVDTMLLFSGRLYADARSWKRTKNQALLDGHCWPSRDWMRVVASRETGF